MTAFRIILLVAILQITIIITLISGFYNEPEEAEEQEERQEYYLQLQNMTTQEILLFKNKKDFIKTIKDYDSVKYFLKGTEEENTNQLLEWYYPGYKKM